MIYLRFGIRDLLWAMVVVGLAIGWWLDHDRIAHYKEMFLATQNLLRATMDHQKEVTGTGMRVTDTKTGFDYDNRD